VNAEYTQKTIASVANCSDIGVHSGQTVNLTVKPAPINHGIKFMRSDLPNRPCVQARFNKVVDTSMATVLGSEGFIISTIEHLMAALTGLAIDNALVEVDSYELPIMDGSAGPFTRILKKAGIEHQDAPRCFFEIRKPIELSQGGKFVGIYPAPNYRISCMIEFDHPMIQKQEFSTTITPGNFERLIADARTFGFLQEVEYLKRFGLGQGGSLENAVIVDQTGVLNNEGLRWADEFVRHKLLDCIGDFALLGLPIKGHIVAKRSGHQFHHAFLEKLFHDKNAWQAKTFENPEANEQPTLKEAAN
jgi:UDP-3-O-[3-hydroxymyristoyl] N-acetylglucosamine deacetylase